MSEAAGVTFSWILFAAVCVGGLELRALHVAAGSAAAAGLELLLLLEQGNCWHGAQTQKIDYISWKSVLQLVKCSVLPFLLQSMEAMFEWEVEDEDKEDKVLWPQSCDIVLSVLC